MADDVWINRSHTAPYFLVLLIEQDESRRETEAQAFQQWPGISVVDIQAQDSDVAGPIFL